MSATGTRLADACFLVAVPAGLVGMVAGIVMGATQNFILAPAHAHLNLLGWVSMALFGLYYRGADVPTPRLARAQVAVSAAGFWIMPLGLALYLGLDDHRFEPLVYTGALLSFAGMGLFAVVVGMASVRRGARGQMRLT
jgi:hypothetical protein